MRARHVQAAVAPRPPSAVGSALCQLSSEGVAEPSSTGTPSDRPRQTARSRAEKRALLLLVGRIVLLVDHDQASAAATRRSPSACPAPDPRAPDAPPASLQPLRRCRAAVQRRPGAGRESARQARLRLGRQVDLGTSTSTWPPASSTAGPGADRPRLAAAGGAEQQHRPGGIDAGCASTSRCSSEARAAEWRQQDRPTGTVRPLRLPGRACRHGAAGAQAAWRPARAGPAAARSAPGSSPRLRW